MSYMVSAADKAAFERDGFVCLRGVLNEAEMAADVDPVYFKFLRGEVPVPGTDLCDMSIAAKGRSREEFTIYNVMLPRLYYPTWQGNLLERRCRDIARQLCGDDMHLDFDQILAKRPRSDDSIMAWHQDAGYWPPLDSDTTTANCWVAVSDVPLESGCMQYVAGSHLEPELRKHMPAAQNREDSHALKIDLDEAQERVVEVPMRRGDVLVHRERVVHGSAANRSDNWRCAYVLNFKRADCIAEERRKGFTHSHNDEVNWDKFITA